MSGRKPFLYDGSLADGIDPMECVIARIQARLPRSMVAPLLRERGTIEAGDIVLK